jgi:hypothetical protein
MGYGKGWGKRWLNSPVNPSQKSFSISFQNGTTLPRQFEKILPMMMIVFAKFAGAEPVVLRECQPKT